MNRSSGDRESKQSTACNWFRRSEGHRRRSEDGYWNELVATAASYIRSAWFLSFLSWERVRAAVGFGPRYDRESGADRPIDKSTLHHSRTSERWRGGAVWLGEEPVRGRGLHQ